MLQLMQKFTKKLSVCPLCPWYVYLSEKSHKWCHLETKIYILEHASPVHKIFYWANFLHCEKWSSSTFLQFTWHVRNLEISEKMFPLLNLFKISVNEQSKVQV